MNKLKKITNKGITLVELLIVLALISIILGGAYALFGLGNKTFAVGTKQYDIQSSLRLGEDYLLKNLRFVTDAEIIDATAIPSVATIPPYENYIFYNNVDKTITHYNKFFTKTVSIGKPGTIQFESNSPSKTLSFNITAQNGSQNYNISSEIYCINLGLGVAEAVTGTPLPSTTIIRGNALKFKSANDYMSILLRPVVNMNGQNREDRFDINFDREIVDATINLVSGIDPAKVSRSISGDKKTLTVNINLTGHETVPDNTKIEFTIIFEGTVSNENTYDYKAIYDDDKDVWYVE